MIRTLLAAAAFGLAACVGAPDPEEAAAGGPDQICKYETVTGSRTAIRQCRTAEEWAAIARRQSAPSSIAASRNSTQLPSHVPGTGPGGGRSGQPQ